MKKSLLIASTAFFVLSNVAIAADIKSLMEPQVKNQFADKTVTTIPIITMDGKLVDNTLTVYFNKDGKLTGRFTTAPTNDPKDDTGKWIVKSDGTLCATWDHWNQTKSICVAIYKVNNALILINHDTNKLETIILDENIKTGNQV